jgi:hypothetical protein
MTSRGTRPTLSPPRPPAPAAERAHFATTGSATGAASPQPQPVFRPGGGHKARGWAGAVKAALAPSAARVALTGGARLAATLLSRLAGLGFWLLGAPGGSGNAGAARSERKPFPAGARGRGRRRVGGGREAELGRRAQPVEGDAGACNASTATHRTRSAPQHSPLEGVGGDRKQ